MYTSKMNILAFYGPFNTLFEENGNFSNISRGGGGTNWQKFQPDTQSMIMKACIILLITQLDP